MVDSAISERYETNPKRVKWIPIHQVSSIKANHVRELYRIINHDGGPSAHYGSELIIGCSQLSKLRIQQMMVFWVDDWNYWRFFLALAVSVTNRLKNANEIPKDTMTLLSVAEF